MPGFKPNSVPMTLQPIHLRTCQLNSLFSPPKFLLGIILLPPKKKKKKSTLGWSDNSSLGGQPGLFGRRWWHCLPPSRKENKGIRLRASGRARAVRMFVQYSATAQGAASRVRQACLAVGLHLKHLKAPQGPEGLKLETLRVGERGWDFYIIKNGLYYHSGLPGIAETG